MAYDIIIVHKKQPPYTIYYQLMKTDADRKPTVYIALVMSYWRLAEVGNFLDGSKAKQLMTSNSQNLAPSKANCVGVQL